MPHGRDGRGHQAASHLHWISPKDHSSAFARRFPSADVDGAAAEPDADDPYKKYDKYLADYYLDTERVRGRSLLSEQEQKAERKLLRRGRLTDREKERLSAGREDKLHEPTLPPGADRWSTWGDGELGPEPRPEWLVIADGAVDSRLGVVKTGKEADVHLVERWVPDSGDAYTYDYEHVRGR